LEINFNFEKKNTLQSAHIIKIQSENSEFMISKMADGGWRLADARWRQMPEAESGNTKCTKQEKKPSGVFSDSRVEGICVFAFSIA
jgi:hypothetical protein